VRHAAPEIDPARSPARWRLSGAGRAAAAALRETVRVDAVVSSPEPKALETAAALDAPLEVDLRLREQDRAGVPFFASRDDFVAAVEAGFARPGDVVLGVESFDAARARFAAAVEAARDGHPGERVALVSHGTVIALYLARLTGGDAVQLWRGLAMPDVRQLPH
jgi:2,3-bisphosphoglycerate-dependent phosphoglycerate mutase